MKLLLTGFEAFLGMDTNPTEEVVKKLSGKKIGKTQVTGKVLPVDFQSSAKKLEEYIKSEQPDAVIMLGLAAGRNRITPERVAINCMDGEPDNAGNVYQDKKIIADGPDAYFSTLPIREIVNTLQQHTIPANISNTAGTYLCNQIMYAARHYVETHGLPTTAGFIHIPAHHELALQKPKLPSWSLRDLTEAVELIIEKVELAPAKENISSSTVG